MGSSDEGGEKDRVKGEDAQKTEGMIAFHGLEGGGSFFEERSPLSTDKKKRERGGSLTV